MRKVRKQIVSVCLAIVLMFSGLYVTDSKVKAADAMSTVTTLSNTNAKPGDIITVKVSLKNCTANSMSLDGLKISVNLDTNKLEFVQKEGASSNDIYENLLPVSSSFITETYSNGVVAFGYADAKAPIKQDSDIFSFSVRVKSTLTSDTVSNITTDAKYMPTGGADTEQISLIQGTNSLNILAADPVISLNNAANTNTVYTDKVVVSVDKGTAVVSDGNTTNNVTSTTPYIVNANGTYTVSAVDAAGNTSTTTFTVKMGVKSIAVSSNPTKTSYVESSATSLDATGGKLTVTYNDDSMEIVDLSKATLTTPDLTTIGSKSVTVTYAGKTTTFDITVVAKSITSITVKTTPTKTQYPQGTNIDLTGGVLTVNYNNGTSSTVDMGQATVTNYDNSKVGAQTVTLSYGGMSTTLDVTVTQKKVTDFTLSGTTGLSVTEGLALDLSKVTAVVTYDNATTENIAVTNAMISYTDVPGTQTVTVKYGEVTKTFSITVNAKVATAIEMKTLPKVEYKEGETFSLDGATIVVKYNNNTVSNPIAVTSSMITSGTPSMTNFGVSQTVTITYNSFSTTFNYIVHAKQLSEITVTAPTKTTYIEKNSFSVTGGSINLKYDNNTSSIVNLTSSNCSGYDMTKVGKQTVTVTYTEGTITKTATFDIIVNAKSLASIAVKTQPTSTTVLEAKELSVAGGKLTLTYDNGDTQDIDMTQATVSGFDNTKIGAQTVTLTYGGVTTTLNVTVKAKTLTSIQVTTNPVKTEYLVGDTFSKDGIVVIAKYDNDTTADVTSKAVVTDPSITVVDSTKQSEVKTVTVSYVEGTVTKTATFNITVVSKANVNAINADISNVISTFTKTGSSISDIDVTTLSDDQATQLVDKIIGTSSTEGIVDKAEKLTYDVEKAAVLSEINNIKSLLYNKAYALTDSITGITFTADKGAVRIDTKLVAKEASVFALAAEGKTFDVLSSYEFSCLRIKDNTEVSLNGNLSIKIPMNDKLKSLYSSLKDDEQIMVAHKLDDGSIEYITPTFINGNIVFEASSLSPFEIVKVTTLKTDTTTNDTTASDVTTNSTTSDSVKTGDSTNTICIIFIMTCAFSAFAISLVSRKKKVKVLK